MKIAVVFWVEMKEKLVNVSIVYVIAKWVLGIVLGVLEVRRIKYFYKNILPRILPGN